MNLNLDIPVNWKILDIYHPKLFKQPLTLGGFRNVIRSVFSQHVGYRGVSEHLLELQPKIVDLLSSTLSTREDLKSFLSDPNFAKCDYRLYWYLLEHMCERLSIPVEERGELFGLHVFTPIHRVLDYVIEKYESSWPDVTKKAFADTFGRKCIARIPETSRFLDGSYRFGRLFSWSDDFLHEYQNKYNGNSILLSYALPFIDKSDNWYIEKFQEYQKINTDKIIVNHESSIAMSYLSKVSEDYNFDKTHPIHESILRFLNIGSLGEKRLQWFSWMDKHYSIEERYDIIKGLLQSTNNPNAHENICLYIESSDLSKYGEEYFCIILDRIKQETFERGPDRWLIPPNSAINKVLQVWSALSKSAYWKSYMLDHYASYQDWESSTVNDFLIPCVFNDLPMIERQRFVQHVYSYPQNNSRIIQRIMGKGKHTMENLHMMFLESHGYSDASVWIQEAQNLKDFMTLAEYIRGKICIGLEPIYLTDIAYEP